MNLNTELNDFLRARQAIAVANYYGSDREGRGTGARNDPVTDRAGWYRNTHEGRQAVQMYKQQSGGALPPDYEPSIFEWGANAIGNAVGGNSNNSGGLNSPGVIQNAKGGVVKDGVLKFSEGDSVPGQPSMASGDMLKAVLQDLDAEYQPQNAGAVQSTPAAQPATGPSVAMSPAGVPLRRPPGPRVAASPPGVIQTSDADRAYDPGRDMGVVAQDPQTGQAVQLDKSTIEQALAGGAKFANEVFNLKSKGVLGNQQHPEAHEGSQALLQRTGAESPQNVQQLDRLMGRDLNDFKEDVWSIKRLHLMYRYYMGMGEMDRANKVAFELMQYSNQVAADYGAKAIQALKGGDTTSAVNSVLGGLSAVADGYTYTYDPKRARVVATDVKTGKEEGTFPVSGQQLYRAAMGLQSDLPWQMMHRRVEAAFSDKSQKRTPAQEELTRANIDLTRARTDAVKKKTAGGGAAAGISPLGQAILSKLRGAGKASQPAGGPGAPPAPQAPGYDAAQDAPLVTEAEGGAVPGYEDGGQINLPTDYWTQPPMSPPNQPPPGLGPTTQGAQSSMMFQKGMGSNDPTFDPDMVPDKKLDRQGNLLVDLPTTPTRRPFAEPHPWTDDDRQHYADMKDVLTHDVPRLGKAERPAVERAVRTEVSDMEAQDKAYAARKKAFETDEAHRAEAELNRQHAEARARITDSKLGAYSAEDLATIRSSVSKAEQDLIGNTTLSSDDVSRSIFGGKQMTPRQREDAVLDIVANNRLPGGAVDVNRATSYLNRLTLAGDTPKERNYFMRGHDVNGNVIVQLADDGTLLHLPGPLMGRLARIAQQRTEERIARVQEENAAAKRSRDGLAYDVKSLKDVMPKFPDRDTTSKKVEELLVPSLPDVLHEKPRGPKYGPTPQFRER